MKTANVGGTFKLCSKAEMRNSEVIGEGCGSMVIYLYNIYVIYTFNMKNIIPHF